MRIYNTFLPLALLLTSNYACSQEIKDIKNEVKLIEVKIEDTPLKDKLAKIFTIDSFQIESIIIEKDNKLYNCLGSGGGIICRKIENK